jgi:hypothetical protein
VACSLFLNNLKKREKIFQFFKGRPLKPPKIKAAPKIKGSSLKPPKIKAVPSKTKYKM